MYIHHIVSYLENFFLIFHIELYRTIECSNVFKKCGKHNIRTTLFKYNSLDDPSYIFKINHNLSVILFSMEI